LSFKSELKSLIIEYGYDSETANDIINNFNCLDFSFLFFGDLFFEFKNRLIQPENTKRPIRINMKVLKEALPKLKKEFGKDEKDVMFTSAKLFTYELVCPLKMYYKMQKSEFQSFKTTIIDRIWWGQELGLYKKNDVESYDDVYNLLFDISYEDVKQVIDEKTEGLTFDNLIDDEFIKIFKTKELYYEKCIRPIDEFNMNNEEIQIPEPSKGLVPKNVMFKIYKRPIYEIFKRLCCDLDFYLAIYGKTINKVDIRMARDAIIYEILSLIKGSIPKEDYANINMGNLAESCFAIILPTMRWTFEHIPTHTFIVAVPDGIGEDFIYEFKATRSKQNLYEISSVGKLQANIYGSLFKREKYVVEVLIQSILNRSEYLRQDYIRKYDFFAIEPSIVRYGPEPVSNADFNISVFELTEMKERLQFLRPRGNDVEICKKCEPFIKKNCYFYNNVVKPLLELEKKLKDKEKNVFHNFDMVR